MEDEMQITTDKLCINTMLCIRKPNVKLCSMICCMVI